MKTTEFTVIEVTIIIMIITILLGLSISTWQEHKLYHDKTVICRTDDNTIIREFEYTRNVYITDTNVQFGRGRGVYKIPNGVSCIVESKK